MIAADDHLTHSELEQNVIRLFTPTSFSGGGGGLGRIGLEIELIPVYADRYPPRPVPAVVLTQVLSQDRNLACEARLSFEPGGQVELSPPPETTVSATLSRARELTSRLRTCGAEHGIEFISSGLNPWHSCDDLGFQTDRPRYRAMQSHFDAIGGAGRRMMRQTAALQICLDLAPGRSGHERWQLANLAGPALAAAFANSPLMEGAPTGRRSARSAIWQEADPSRTGFNGAQLMDGVTRRYLDFALRAEAMPLPGEDGEPLPFRLGFGDWLAMAGTRPSLEDLTHHLTTLFPPVRPRGYLEVRYLDALPERWWPAPVCLLSALMYDATARREALLCLASATRPLMEQWRSAAALGMADGSLRATACALFDIAVEAMPRLPTGYLPPNAATLVEEYRERFPAAGRCPADDQLDRFGACPDDLSTWI